MHLSDPPLIVDSDQVFLSYIQNEIHYSLLPPVVARTYREAQSRLSDPHQSLSGIFINPRVTEWGDEYSLLRLAHLHRPGLPVYLLQNRRDPDVIPFEEHRGLAIQDTLKKPLRYKDITDLVEPLIEKSKVQAAFEASVRSAHAFARGEPPLSEYVPISAKHFLSGRKCYFNVYVQSPTGMMSCLLQAGDPFEPERVLSLIRNGMTRFYIPLSEQKRYLDYCSYLSRELLKTRNVSFEFKTAQVLNLGGQTMEYLVKAGLPHADLKHAAQFAQQGLELLTQLKLDQTDLVRGFLWSLSRCSHGVGCALLASWIALPLQIQSQRLRNMIAMSAFLHDLGIHKLAPDLDHEDPVRMTSLEHAAWLDHPRVGAEILAQTTGFDEVAIQAIHQHHMRRDGSGFPKTAASGVNLIAEVIGIADEIQNLLSTGQPIDLAALNRKFSVRASAGLKALSPALRSP